jgi:histone H3/H4
MIPTAVAEKIIRKAGAERVSRDAAKLLAEILEKKGFEISQKAILLAKHAKRKTITEEDIKLATQ